jgi:hypothetical protein
MRTRQVPQYDQPPPTRDRTILKQRAYAAWKSARRGSPLPSAILDRLWCETLTASKSAPPAVGAVFFYRSEVLFRLIADRVHWAANETDHPRPPSRLRPAPRPGGK